MTTSVPAQDGWARWSALALLAAAELLGMSLWFSASAVTPALLREWNLAPSIATWITLAVQIGFVCGTLVSALFNLPDVLPTRLLFAASAIAGAAFNAGLAEFAHGAGTAVVLRLLTGFALAGVYPPGMKIMATWFSKGRGMAIGVLVGALTLGKASPYLINALDGTNWRGNVLATSALAAIGGLIVWVFVKDGPYTPPRARFDIHQVRRILSNRSIRLANFGYFGHMWELYAMWTWAPVMIRASFAAAGKHAGLAETAAFLVLGAGAAGCVAAGILADRVGRTVVTSWAMTISGACCLMIGFGFQAQPWILLTGALVWGASVVADSAQFSTCVTELTEPQYAGTALTIQTSIGFLLTTISIELIPILVDRVGWRYAFIALAPGPFLGVLSMLRLRALPEAVRLAGGRR